MKHYKLIITENLVGMRIDKINTLIFEDLTRSRLQQLVKSGCVTLNDATIDSGSVLLKFGDVVNVIVPDPVSTDMKEADIAINVVYEDNDLLVINKQAGLTVHPGAGNHNDTMANALLKHCKGNLSGIGGVMRPGIVHRLDRDTSGLMVVAKNDVAHVSLSEQISSRALKRVYQAIVWDTPVPHSGVISTLIDRSRHDRTRMQVVNRGGKEAITHYKVLEIYKHTSLVECRLETGRTHQIRVHMSHIGNSIVGDQAYGHNDRKIQKYYKNDAKTIEILQDFKRQALHSCYIEFTHPSSGKTMDFSASFPEDIEMVKSRLSEDAQSS